MKTLEITSYEHWTLTMRERSEDILPKQKISEVVKTRKKCKGEKKIVQFKNINFLQKYFKQIESDLSVRHTQANFARLGERGKKQG